MGEASQVSGLSLIDGRGQGTASSPPAVGLCSLGIRESQVGFSYIEALARGIPMLWGHLGACTLTCCHWSARRHPLGTGKVASLNLTGCGAMNRLYLTLSPLPAFLRTLPTCQPTNSHL